MNEQKVALITGANKGLGYETARQLGKQNIKVLIGARDETRGREAAEKLLAEGCDAEFILLDVGDEKTHEAAAKYVAENYGKLDILVNNAGIVLESLSGTPSDVSLETLRKTFDTNFFGVIAVTKAFLPLIKKSEGGRIVNVSSGLGSLAQNSDANCDYAAVKPLAYNSSKTALNAFTVILAHELKEANIKVNSADPGYTATDLNGNQGTKTVEQGASVITDLATLPNDGATGGYFDDEGVVPW
ncbi:MAG: SDR family oxidoreductase [Pyrinomonadaceae bacterium]|nr:SDR family oxidoreductase [Pyrinomonadaceae bacterium]